MLVVDSHSPPSPKEQLRGMDFVNLKFCPHKYILKTLHSQQKPLAQLISGAPKNEVENQDNL